MNSIKDFYLKRERAILGSFFICFLLASWEVLARTHIINPFFTSYPSKIVVTLGQQAADGTLLRNLRPTMLEFVIAFGLSAVVALLLGFLMGWYRVIEYAADPFMWLLYCAPLIALYPLLVIWFGMGARIAIFLGFLLAFVQITVNTVTGIRDVDPILIKAARSFGASNRVIFVRIMIPGALPMIISGLRLGIGRSLIGVIVAEMFSASHGLGYEISYFGAQLKTAPFFAALLVVVIIGVISDQILRAVEQRFSRWHASG